MAKVDVEIDALRAFHDALTRYRYAQRDVADRGDNEIQVTLASLEAKADRWQAILHQRQADLEACTYRASAAAQQGGYIDCSSYARAVYEAEERLEHVRRWRGRVEDEAAAFRRFADRFRNLLENDVPRTDRYLLAIIKRLESVRSVQAPGS